MVRNNKLFCLLFGFGTWLGGVFTTLCLVALFSDSPPGYVLMWGLTAVLIAGFLAATFFLRPWEPNEN